ncbi:heme peroxidase family protein [Actinoplanes sp. NPDC048796]|uniref:peroxidase family protein n=1 Tax=Actinoplanes sp. NPDC048796 TaxID=3155640 RepID=UPI0033C6A76C
MDLIERPSAQDAYMLQDSLFRETGAAEPDDFTTMFPELEPFAPCTDAVIHNVRLLGARDGLMDAKDPRITVTDPIAANPIRNPDNPNPDMTVGFTFLGQFIDHDLTFDPMPIRCGQTKSPNLRSRFFDLDSVYGRGPDEDRHLYDRASELDHAAPIKFLIDFDAPRDLPRTSQQRAIIADPRNDENVIISQLHLAFLRFHNEVTDHLAETRADDLALLEPTERPRKLFEWAQCSVRRHYQWIVVNQFLAATLDPVVFAAVESNGPKVYRDEMTEKIPREFQVAAYRFGHSQVRPGYQLNAGFGAPIFDRRVDPREGDPNDLRGGRRAPRRFVEWDNFFDFGTKEIKQDTGEVVDKVKRNKRIDPYLSSPLFDLPVGPGLVEPDDDLKSLAGRNLERHLQHGIASGQAIAARFHYTPLTAAETAELHPLGFRDSTPLWYYVLKEALIQHHGQRLGQVGSRIVAEVFFGLLAADPHSYRNVTGGWTPDLPTRDPRDAGSFTMTDLLTMAGVA